MADLTPAEQLRAAAAKLREMAKAASRGPWLAGDCELYPRWILTEGERDKNGYNADVIRIAEDEADVINVSDADWQWMAFASPALAEPLAALFDHYAAKYERLGETFGYPVTKPSDRLAEGKPQLHIDFALAVARVILGDEVKVAEPERVRADALEVNAVVRRPDLADGRRVRIVSEPRPAPDESGDLVVLYEYPDLVGPVMRVVLPPQALFIPA